MWLQKNAPNQLSGLNRLLCDWNECLYLESATECVPSPARTEDAWTQQAIGILLRAVWQSNKRIDSLRQKVLFGVRVYITKGDNETPSAKRHKADQSKTTLQRCCPAKQNDNFMVTLRRIPAIEGFFAFVNCTNLETIATCQWNCAFGLTDCTNVIRLIPKPPTSRQRKASSH